MILLVASEPDIASMNIKERILSLTDWKLIEEKFDGNPVYVHDNFLMITLKNLHIYAENFDRALKDAGFDFDRIIVLSRHKSEMGIPTLTVHPVGNFGKAEFGGKDRDFAPANPSLMGASLRKLADLGRELTDYKLSLEVTHHGPYVETPIMFIEIGSEETRWRDRVAGELIARTVLEMKEEIYPVIVGIGGGHYAPRFTEMQLKRKLNFAHMIPEYAVPHIDMEVLEKLLAKPKPDWIYVHEKGLKKENLHKIRDLLQSFSIPECSSKDFEPLDIKTNPV
ncbi:MAG: D-aminoacyl-tRNA deacylase [Thermoplasmata archaeon]